MMIVKLMVLLMVLMMVVMVVMVIVLFRVQVMVLVLLMVLVLELVLICTYCKMFLSPRGSADMQIFGKRCATIFIYIFSTSLNLIPINIPKIH